jgi:hypothetical protein
MNGRHQAVSQLSWTALGPLSQTQTGSRPRQGSPALILDRDARAKEKQIHTRKRHSTGLLRAGRASRAKIVTCTFAHRFAQRCSSPHSHLLTLQRVKSTEATGHPSPPRGFYLEG